jgi:hypothetical protein
MAEIVPSAFWVGVVEEKLLTIKFSRGTMMHLLPCDALSTKSVRAGDGFPLYELVICATFKWCAHIMVAQAAL